MNLKSILIIVPIAFAVMYSCDSSKKESTESDTSAENEKLESTETESQSASTAVTVSHSVSDFDVWLTAFNNHDSVRTANGMSSATVHRTASDTNMVTVTVWTKDHASARDFFGKQELKDAMQEAGVNSEPEITFWDVNWAREQRDEQFDEVIFITHEVTDFDQWSQLFNDHDSIRLENGIVALVTGTNADMPKIAGVYLGIRDKDAAMAFMESPELQKVMKEAGVVGEPDISMLSVVN